MRFSNVLWLSLAALSSASAQETFVQPVGSLGSPIQFELRTSGAVRTANGTFYRGDAAIVTPLGPMTLVGSDLFFEYEPGTTNVKSVRGRAFVPTPLSGEKVSIDEPVLAELGYDLGKNIADLGVPLQEDRGYIYFKFDAGLNIRVGEPPSDELEQENDASFTISFPAGASSRIVVDPLDPMYYFSGGITIPNKSGKKDGDGRDDGTEEGGGFGKGSSHQGLFPFRPLVTWGIEDKARPFNGHRIETGTIPLFGLPITVRGHIITNLDPLTTGERAVDPLGIGFGPLAQAGANGRFEISLDFLKLTGLGKIMNLTIPLGKATAAAEIVNDRQLAYISGIAGQEANFGFSTLLSHNGELKTAAVLSTVPEESRLYMEGQYKLGASEFGKAVGFDVGNLVVVNGSLRADRDGLFVYGQSEAGVSAGPVSTNGELAVEMSIPAQDPESRYLQLSGQFRFVGAATNGVTRVDNSGLFVSGRLLAPKFDMTVSGGVTSGISSDPFVYGNMTVPEALQPDFQAGIQRVANSAKAEIASKLSDYRAATKDFEFELSLRGMRTVVPPIVDTIIREIDDQIPAQINRNWPNVNTPFGRIEAPGKATALRVARSQSEPHKDRLRHLKQQMLRGDSQAARSALVAAIRQVLNNPRIVVRYDVPVVNRTITIVDHAYVNASVRSRLETALAGVRALPEASERKVRADRIWNDVPKREILMQAADAIEKGIANAVPRVQSIGFRFPLSRPEWEYQVVVTHQGNRSTISLRIAPDSIADIGSAIGQALGQVL